MKIQQFKEAFEQEGLSAEQIKERIEENVPVGVPAEKWTKTLLACPACGQLSLDEFTGGVNIQDHEISHTEHIYHCRVCGLNLTEEEFKNAS